MRDSNGLMAVPKADPHNHALLGGRLADYRAFCGVRLPDPPEFFDFKEFDEYVVFTLSTHLKGAPNEVLEHYLFLFARTIEAARRNGVAVLETSLDCTILDLYGGDAGALVDEFGRVIEREAATAGKGAGGPMRVSLGSDDALVFGSEVSEEYLRLYESGSFTSEELDAIRLTGLEA